VQPFPSVHDLRAPIGVFDAGIGSYGMVQVIRQHFPRQDILYLADRASFPYGTKSRQELACVVTRAIEALAVRGARAVVLASNAPSVVVLDEIAPALSLPVLGIYPPVAQALRRTRSGQVAVLGVQSLVQSPEILAYVQRQAQGRPVSLVNASPLVALVAQVGAFMDRLLHDRPGTDVCTLSSTHLPWLLRYFEAAAPCMQFLDPAQELVSRLRPHCSEGSGATVCLATASSALPLEGLAQMLRLLGVDLQPQWIRIDQEAADGLLPTRQSSSSPGSSTT
jgi:glutamate racemase